MADKKIDPICGMSGTISAHGQWFCSLHCLRIYEKKKHLLPVKIKGSGIRNIFSNRLTWTILIILILLSLSFVLPPLGPFRNNFLQYLKIITITIILGLGLGGAIDYFVPKEYISQILSGTSKKTIVRSVGLGFLMSACSHGILALSIELYRKGASVAAVISFLLASPWANLPITILLFGFFGFKAFLIIISALIIAINTGLTYLWLDKKGLIEKNPHSLKLDKDFAILKDIKGRFKNYKFSSKQLFQKDIPGVWKGAVTLGDMVLWWIILGMGLASLAGAYIPTHFFHKFMGPTFIGLLITLALATVIEVCSEGTSPLAFEIYRQTGALGNSFTFLMAGVVTDYTEIGLVWTNIGRRAALWLPVITLPQVIFLAVIFNK
jgi:uncharacterized membrane protein YraQ (UPF0718 family)